MKLISSKRHPRSKSLNRKLVRSVLFPLLLFAVISYLITILSMEV